MKLIFKNLIQKFRSKVDNVVIVFIEKTDNDNNTYASDIFGVFSDDRQARLAVENERLNDLGINYQFHYFEVDYRNKNVKPKYWTANEEVSDRAY